MSKKYYRFFWGFLNKQENWLNEMADKGCRLINTGRAWYEWEDCEPGKYRYAVEFVGGKSGQSAREYADFLEDCGYRVLFKNLNLDYSVGKAVFRPWAEKGGKIATSPGTYNKELLIVEKENDGMPFELHTAEEDIKEYKRSVRKPFIFTIVTILIVALFAVCLPFILKSLGVAVTKNATRIGYIGSSGYSSWSGRYHLLDGNMRKNLRPKSPEIHIEVTTEEGSISIEIIDSSGSVIFSKQDIGDASFYVPADKKVTVEIEADNHKGSFNIE